MWDRAGNALDHHAIPSRLRRMLVTVLAAFAWIDLKHRPGETNRVRHSVGLAYLVFGSLVMPIYGLATRARLTPTVEANGPIAAYGTLIVPIVVAFVLSEIARRYLAPQVAQRVLAFDRLSGRRAIMMRVRIFAIAFVSFAGGFTFGVLVARG